MKPEYEAILRDIQSRMDLPDPPDSPDDFDEQVENACLYFQEATPIKTPWLHNYTLKHAIEKFLRGREVRGPYISRSAAVVAAVVKGFPIGRDWSGKPRVAISKRSYRKLRDWHDDK